MCLLNCARVKEHLHDSWNWPRSPFDSSNFIRLSSTLRILGFHSNRMEIRCRFVLKRCVLSLSWIPRSKRHFLSLSTLIVEKFEVSPDGIAMFTKPLWDVINSAPVTRAWQFGNELFNNCCITCIFRIICKKRIFLSKFAENLRTLNGQRSRKLGSM